MTDFSSRITKYSRWFYILAAAVILTAPFGLRSAAAAPTAAPGEPVFASVDMSKIIASYSKRAAADAQFKQLQDQYSDVFKTQTAKRIKRN